MKGDIDKLLADARDWENVVAYPTQMSAMNKMAHDMQGLIAKLTVAVEELLTLADGGADALRPFAETFGVIDRPDDYTLFADLTLGDFRRAEMAFDALRSSTVWNRPETAPPDTAVLTYGFGYEVAHFNTFYGEWLACRDHRRIRTPDWWAPLPSTDGLTPAGAQRSELSPQPAKSGA